MTPEGEHLALRQEEAIRDSFARQAFMNHLGARLMTVLRGWCEVIVDYRPELSQQHGYFHGAVIGAIVDNASGYPAFTTKSSVHCSCSWGCLSSARAKRASWEDADSMPGKCPVPRERKGEALCHIVVDFFPLKRSRTVCTPPYSLGKAIENFQCLEAFVGFTRALLCVALFLM
jgi:hypothetical protein